MQSTQPTSEPLLAVQNLGVKFPVKKGLLQRTVAEVKAVSNVSFTIQRGEAFGLVGESGCGKTTLARAVLRLIDATEGTVEFEGQCVSDKDGKALSAFRSSVSAIFQDPFSSLNPRMKTGSIIAEILRVHRYSGNVDERVKELFELCGLSDRFVNLYPHQMSGGQRQRVGIARALALEPKLIVCDEAVSALDVSIQAQIINLLADLQKQLGLTYLFIGHDLSVVRHLCDRVAVMYLGSIVESGSSESLFSNPQHPYTKALIDAVPDPDPVTEADRNIIPLGGEVPSPLNPPAGCAFHPRCRSAVQRCHDAQPQLKATGPHHWAACFIVESNAAANLPGVTQE